MRITPAQPGHWPQIFAFFSAIVAAGESYSYPEALDSANARALWMPGAPARTVVAIDDAADDNAADDDAADDTVLGSALMGPNRPGRGSHVATASFMVDPGRAGAGTGRALGEHVVAWARGAGYRGVQFNAVVETNVRAVGLWRSLGFEIIGTVPGAFRSAAHGFVGLHVMYLDLTGGSDPDEIWATHAAP